MIDIGSLYTRIEADTSGLNKAETNIAAFAKRAAGYFAGIASVAAIGAAIKEVTFATARFDTLGVVMEVVGKNAGYSAREMAVRAGVAEDGYFHDFCSRDLNQDVSGSD